MKSYEIDRVEQFCDRREENERERPDMGGISDMRMIMMIKSSITNEEDKKAIANMGTVGEII